MRSVPARPTFAVIAELAMPGWGGALIDGAVISYGTLPYMEPTLCDPSCSPAMGLT